MFLSESQRKAKDDKEVEKLYQEYQAKEYFAGRGAYQRRPERTVQMQQSETCYYSILMLVMAASATIIIWGIMTISEGNQHIRKHEVELYE